jgi:predicted ArsR family transcriptional regulator
MTQKRPSESGATLTKVNRSLSDPTRIRIFDLLSRGPSTVSELAEKLEIPSDRLYYHLDLLEEGRIIRLQSIRPKRVYELASPLQESPDATSPEETAELAGAMLEAARIEAESVLRRKNGHQHVVLTYATLELAEKDLGKLRTKIIDLIDSMPTGAKRKRQRRTRVIFAAYQLDE